VIVTDPVLLVTGIAGLHAPVATDTVWPEEIAKVKFPVTARGAGTDALQISTDPAVVAAPAFVVAAKIGAANEPPINSPAKTTPNFRIKSSPFFR
jgi:hypothetical protein